MTSDASILIAAMLLVAALYASVGHGGASGYLATMALAGFAPAVMKPTALILNIAVSFLGTVFFFRAGYFSWRLFWPFAVVSIPFAFLGGSLHLPPSLFKILLAIALLMAALRLFLPEPTRPAASLRVPQPWAALLCGATIGLFSGLIGVGGGIFLTPLLIFLRWGDTKTAAAVSAPFILVNSISGLIGHGASPPPLPASLPAMMVAVIAGGWFGSRWGSGSVSAMRLRPALGLVLVIASVKMLIL